MSLDIATAQNELRSMWQLPYTYRFLSLFKDALHVNNFHIDDLENALISPEANHSFLSDLFIPVMKPVLKPKQGAISNINWEAYIKQEIEKKTNVYFSQYNDTDNPFIDDHFSHLPLKDRLLILKCLCDWNLIKNKAIQDITNSPDQDPDELRVSPVGQDKDRCIYWYFGDQRLWKEIPPALPLSQRGRKSIQTQQQQKPNRWELQCASKESWETFVEEMGQSEVQCERQLSDNIGEFIEGVISKINNRLRSQRRNQVVPPRPIRSLRLLEQNLRKIEQERLELERRRLAGEESEEEEESEDEEELTGYGLRRRTVAARNATKSAPITHTSSGRRIVNRNNDSYAGVQSLTSRYKEMDALEEEYENNGNNTKDQLNGEDEEVEAQQDSPKRQKTMDTNNVYNQNNHNQDQKQQSQPSQVTPLKLKVVFKSSPQKQNNNINNGQDNNQNGNNNNNNINNDSNSMNIDQHNNNTSNGNNQNGDDNINLESSFIEVENYTPLKPIPVPNHSSNNDVSSNNNNNNLDNSFVDIMNTPIRPVQIPATTTTTSTTSIMPPIGSQPIATPTISHNTNNNNHILHTNNNIQDNTIRPIATVVENQPKQQEQQPPQMIPQPQQPQPQPQQQQ